MRLLTFLIVLALLATALPCQEIPAPSEFVAHEWGTFTSVAGPDGAPVQWAPLLGTSDLPCFVDRLSTRNLKQAPGLVRMETPVLYFYSARPLVASVSVQFPRGLITEWYPQATRVMPEIEHRKYVATTKFEPAEIDWDSVQISPAKTMTFPTIAGASRYFAARNTDAAPVQVGKQQEKFIFYRGVGYFDVTLQPKFLAGGGLQIRNTGANAIAVAIVFENHSGAIGYHVVHNLTSTADIDLSELTGTVDSLRQELIDQLAEFGLYEKEAQAMLETWHDSWFEEGMRIIYLVPRPIVDSVLPLTITPQPSSTTRVFVGRVELLSPRVRQTITTALETGDVDTLAKFGRFLNPFLEQINPRQSRAPSPQAASYLQQAYTKMNEELQSASCVK